MVNKAMKMNESHNNIHHHADPSHLTNETQTQLLQLEQSLELLDTQLAQEQKDLTIKYFKLKTPIFKNRNDLVQAIPEFWLTAMSNHPLLNTVLENQDIDAFRYLQELIVEKDSSRRKFIFKFSENPYFTNTELLKEIIESEDDWEVVNYPIHWKNGMDLTNPKANVYNGKKRTDSETGSFFAWFSDEDLEVAELIADDLYVHAIKYYLGGGGGSGNNNGNPEEHHLENLEEYEVLSSEEEGEALSDDDEVDNGLIEGGDEDEEEDDGEDGEGEYDDDDDDD